MPNLKAAATVLRDYGQRSTLHGLSHMYQSGDMWRRTFWLVLTFGGCIACFYHIYATVANYLESPITSVFRDEGVATSFPDVTICNLKPVSETLLHTPSERQQLFDHLESNWNFFRDWIPEQRSRRSNESRVNYKLRQRDLFKTYMDVFWTSDDTRDFGLSDSHMLLSCHYNSRRCNEEDFQLTQHNRYWNCYTFVPKDRTVESSDQDSGLKLILFTDSNFDKDRLTDLVRYRRSKYKNDEVSRPYDLEGYLNEGDRTMNQVLTGNSWEAEGLRIFVHRKSQHPTTASISYDISNGASTTVEFSEVQVNALNSPPEHICNENTPELVPYVRYFSDSSKSIGLKEYSLTQAMAVIEEKQRIIYEKCKCYSHLLPFRFNTSMLCLFAPPDQRLKPSKTLLHRISCHARAYRLAESLTASLMQKMEAFTPCTNWKLHAAKTEVPWPRSDELIDFVNYVVLPRFRQPESANVSLSHHLLSASNFSRSESVLGNMFNASCRPEDKIGSHSLSNAWCISRNKLMTNVARIWIKPDSPRSAVYIEDYSYDWPEALSEVGGIFGLWMGISLLSVCEFIELVFILATVCASSSRNRGGGGVADRLLTQQQPDFQLALRQALLLDQGPQGDSHELPSVWTASTRQAPNAGGRFNEQQRVLHQLQLHTAVEAAYLPHANSPTNRRPMRLDQQQQQQH